MNLGNLQAALVNRPDMTPDEALRFYHDPANLQALQSVLSGYLEAGFPRGKESGAAAEPAVEPYAELEARAPSYAADREAAAGWAAARSDEIRAAGAAASAKLAAEAKPASGASGAETNPEHARVEAEIGRARAREEAEARIEAAAAEQYRRQEIGLAGTARLALGPAFSRDHSPIEKAKREAERREAAAREDAQKDALQDPAGSNGRPGS